MKMLFINSRMLLAIMIVIYNNSVDTKIKSFYTTITTLHFLPLLTYGISKGYLLLQTMAII